MCTLWASQCGGLDLAAGESSHTGASRPFMFNTSLYIRTVKYDFKATLLYVVNMDYDSFNFNVVVNF